MTSAPQGNGALAGEQLNGKDGLKGEGKPLMQAKRGIQTHADGQTPDVIIFLSTISTLIRTDPSVLYWI